MISKAEKLHASMSRLPIIDCRKAWVSRVHAEQQRNAALTDMLDRDGFERVEESGFMTEDGREVMHIIGAGAWALKPDVHATRREEALKEAAQQKRPSVKHVGELSCRALVDGQLCGGDLKRDQVCPRCALGKMGVTATLTCEVCGAVTAEMVTT